MCATDRNESRLFKRMSIQLFGLACVTLLRRQRWRCRWWWCDERSVVEFKYLFANEQSFCWVSTFPALISSQLNSILLCISITFGGWCALCRSSQSLNAKLGLKTFFNTMMLFLLLLVNRYSFILVTSIVYILIWFVFNSLRFRALFNSAGGWSRFPSSAHRSVRKSHVNVEKKTCVRKV